MEEHKNSASENAEHKDLESSKPEQSDALVACKKELDGWKEKYIRVAADLENFSKRVDKERIQWRVSGQAALLTPLLEIVDDFDRAFEQLHKNGSDAQSQSWVTGFELIRKALHKFLDAHEVVEIPTNIPFDTQYHEALMEVESPGAVSGSIVAVLQKGYTFKGAVLRVAKVSVAQ